MRTKSIWPILMGLVFLCAGTNLAAKSEAVDNGSYTTADKEFYLTPEEIYFIRPGLNLEVLDVVIPADKQLLVTFSLQDPSGLPLDINGVFTPGPVDMRYILTYIPQSEEQMVNLTGGSYDRYGTLTSLGDGVYTYKFATILPDIYDPDATHTLAVLGRRDLREFELDRYVANILHNFVPSGMYPPMPRDVVTTETCARCHNPLPAMHGGRYNEYSACAQCHNPGMEARGGGDGRHLSMDILIHDVHQDLEAGYTAALNDCEVCHTGGTPTENFPLVASPNPVPVCDMSRFGTTELSWGDLDEFEIHVNAADGPLWGRSKGTGSKQTGKWVKDGTVFFLIDKATGKTVQKLSVNATVLGCAGNAPGAFRGVAGAQHTNWLNHASSVVCGSCHDDVNFETGEGHSDFNIVQPDDAYCGHCHIADTGNEFDWSIRGAHKPLYKSAQFPGVLVKLLSITDTNPGDYPTVTFSVASKNGPLDPTTMNRVRLMLSGPNDDFVLRAQETVGTKAVKVGNNWAYTFATQIPLDAEGSYTISAEARDLVDIDLGIEVSEERDSAENPQLAFAVTDATAQPRRTVVDDYKCENCHSNLSFHGGNRHDPDYCATCHKPDLADEVSAHLKFMTHAIHRGEDLEKGYAVGGRVYDDVVFPGDLRNCDACHVNDSQQLSLPAGLLPTITPNLWWDPMMPAASACLSCHDGISAAAHAYANTSFFGESCASCHGEGKIYSVDKMHAR